MKDVLNNEVNEGNFVPNEVDNVIKTKDSKSKWWHTTLVSDTYVFVRINNKHGDIIGWNRLPREQVYA